MRIAWLFCFSFCFIFVFPNAAVALDYGDAPASYGTPTHTITTLRLGASVDNDLAALSSSDALGDDNNGADDENGVGISITLIKGRTYTLPVSVQAATGYLNAWFDWNRDGDFLDSGEQVATEQAVPIGTTRLAVAVPVTAVTGTSFARFRICSTLGECNTPSSAAASGEVEDYSLIITNSGAAVPIPATSCGNLLTGEDQGRFGLLASGVRNLESPPSGGYSYIGALTAAATYVVVSQVSSESIHPSTGAHWSNLMGHTTGAVDDAYLAVNGSTAVGIFYQEEFALPASGDYQIALWGINAVIQPTFIGGEPDIGIRVIRVADGATIAQTSTGLIPQVTTTTFTGSNDWTQGVANFTVANAGLYRLEVFNISTAASGNDFAIDDISIAPLDEESCPKDYSDAPLTNTSYGSASHEVTTDLKMGASITAELAAFDSPTATGDADDGVSSFPAISTQANSYSLNTIVTNITGTAARLHGWIDLNRNGSFESAEYTSVAVPTGTTNGTVTLNWASLPGLTAGNTFARLRLTTAAMTGANAATMTSDGEVEDYAVTIAAPLVYPAAENEAECPVAAGATFTPSYQVGWNHGGADPYAPTLQASDIAAAQSITAGSGISYLIDLSTGRILNANQTGRVDAYQAGDYAQYSFTTSASVSAGRFWKGLRYGVMSTASIHTPYKISVLASTDPTFTTATLLLDGHTVTAPASGYVQTVVPFTSSAYLLPSTTYYLRVIFHDATSSSGELRWDDLVVGFADCRDYSDAPTTSTSYGSASHAVVSGGSLRLGADIDAENTGLASANADGDDTLGLDDEASVSSFPNLSTTSGRYSLNLIANNNSGSPASLVGWIDFNRNGVFDSNEAAASSVATGANNKLVGLTWPSLPADIQAGQSYLRLRFTSDPNIATGTATTSQATGLAFDGEVEDYLLTIGDGGLSLSGRVYHDADVNGSDTAEAGIGLVTIVLHDTINNTCRSTQTDAEGQYEFSGVLAGNYTVYEAAAETLPEPRTCPPVAADPTGYESSTANTQNLTLSTTSLSGIDFGDVRLPQFTLEHNQAILPGSSVTYPHRFTAFTAGSVSFSTTANTSPSSLNWGTVLYVDSNCNAELDGGDTPLNSAYLMNAGDTLCLLAKVLSPTDVSSGASHTLTLTSDFLWGDGSLLPTPVTQSRVDLTQTTAGGPMNPIDGAGKLKLSKAVWNVTRNIQGDVTLPGEILRYTLSYENIGNGVLDALVVQDTVPEFTQMLGGSQQCGLTPPELSSCTPAMAGAALEWGFSGKLLPGSQGEVFYEVLVE